MNLQVTEKKSDGVERLLQVEVPADMVKQAEDKAARRGTDAGQLYASLQKAGRLKEIERGITEEKVFKWLFEQNTVE